MYCAALLAYAYSDRLEGMSSSGRRSAVAEAVNDELKGSGNE